MSKIKRKYLDFEVYEQSEITTISGDIVGQIPTDYYTTGEVDTISGVLTTEIDSDITTHISADDHTQYLRTDGTRELSADWYAGSYNVTTSGHVSIGTDSDIADLNVNGTFALLNAGETRELVSAFGTNSICYWWYNGTGWFQPFWVADTKQHLIDEGIDFSDGWIGAPGVKCVALEAGSGAEINEFSTDGTFTGNSDSAVPTEKAVKSYVDGLFGGLGSVEEAPYVKVSDVKAETAGGGTFTSGAWRTRDLNTEDSDTDGICTLSSNQITLAAGTYECRISCPAINVDGHQARLYNTTASETVIIGTLAYCHGGDYGAERSFINGRFTIAASQVLEVQHICQTTQATTGFGGSYDFDINHVFTVAEFWKIETQLVMGDVYEATSTVAAIKTGTYTGDGSTSKAITGVGFSPKYLFITHYPTGEAAGIAWHRTDQMGIYAYYHPSTTDPHGFLDHRINSLDPDGFTVDDDGSNGSPNANGVVYAYTAIGEKSITAFAAALSPPYVKVSDVKASSTNGGTFTSGAYQTRTLNTEDSDPDGICNLSSNQITLAAGTYECRITAPAIRVDSHKARLRNVTDSVDILIGTAEFSNSVASYASNSSFVSGRFTIAAGKALEVQHRCQTTLADYGFGAANSFGENEVYTVAEFWKVA